MLGDLVAGYGSSESDGAEEDAELSDAKLSDRAPAAQPELSDRSLAAPGDMLLPHQLKMDALTNITNALCRRGSWLMSARVWCEQPRARPSANSQARQP